MDGFKNCSTAAVALATQGDVKLGVLSIWAAGSIAHKTKRVSRPTLDSTIWEGESRPETHPHADVSKSEPVHVINSQVFQKRLNPLVR
jgi:hypothetical protein